MAPFEAGKCTTGPGGCQAKPGPPKPFKSFDFIALVAPLAGLAGSTPAAAITGCGATLACQRPGRIQRRSARAQRPCQASINTSYGALPVNPPLILTRVSSRPVKGEIKNVLCFQGSKHENSAYSWSPGEGRNDPKPGGATQGQACVCRGPPAGRPNRRQRRSPLSGSSLTYLRILTTRL